MLEDFQTGTAPMARKRHLASIARGFYGFCLAPSIHKQIRSIRLIRGRERRTHPAAYCPPGSICDMLSIPRALPPVTQGSALQALECSRRCIVLSVAGLSRGQVFIYVYRLAMDARTRKGDDGAG